ncbi:hypothetical protein BKA69DRAFT_1105061 [Paraphysoderma sedebokerense]|nr:hypothetical protein BKA69DRAFT_1105061 [Paraphysoderma sedebokerense]
MNRPEDFTVPSQVFFMIMLFPILFSVSHSLYMSPRICRRYNLPNNFFTWFLMTIGPSNIELLWSNFFRLKLLSSRKPNIKPEILGLLELIRSIAQDILVIFISERLQREVTIGKILRNCVTVLSLIMTLRKWKTGRLYAKLGYVLLVLPCLLNVVLVFPNGELYKIGYVIFVVSLSIFTSTLLLITKHTAEGSARYTDLAFFLGPISVIGINVLTISTVRNFGLITGYGGPMFLMTMMSLMCLVTNTCHYHKVWEKYEDDRNSLSCKEKK